jgi:hypothetical protein
MRFGLDKVIFPIIYRRAVKLQYFANKMLADRLDRIGEPADDFMEHVVNAKDDHGTPIHSGKVELASECVNLIIGGEYILTFQSYMQQLPLRVITCIDLSRIRYHRNPDRCKPLLHHTKR